MSAERKIYTGVKTTNGFLWHCPACGHRNISALSPVPEDMREEVMEQAREEGLGSLFDEGAEMVPDCDHCERCDAYCFFEESTGSGDQNVPD